MNRFHDEQVKPSHNTAGHVYLDGKDGMSESARKTAGGRKGGDTSTGGVSDRASGHGSPEPKLDFKHIKSEGAFVPLRKAEHDTDHVED